MRRALGLLLGLAGCDRVLGLSTVQDAAPPDTDAAQRCFGVGLLHDVCLDLPLSAPHGLSGTIDTTDDPRCVPYPQTDGPELCIVAAASLDVGDFQAIGTRPLVLIAGESITVHGALSVASTTTGVAGAGSKAACAMPAAAMADTKGAGGGAGGSFAFAGGAGGSGSGGAAKPSGVGPALGLTFVRGGCGGNPGGSLGTKAKGGTAGGAIYLIAATSIVVAQTGSINASGAGGHGGAALSGGGGGGSGGLIGLDAPTVTIDGVVFARGGGGGGGGDTSPGSDGRDPTGPAGAASGGSPGGAADVSGATPGGDGCGGTVGGFTGAAATGGGGGGGGCGYIRLYGTQNGAGAINPPPTQ